MVVELMVRFLITAIGGSRHCDESEDAVRRAVVHRHLRCDAPGYIAAQNRGILWIKTAASRRALGRHKLARHPSGNRR